MRRLPFMLLLLSGGFRLPLLALTIAGYTANTNDRFANHPDFIAKDFNLSGVAVSSDGRWATLIAPNLFLTAHHFPPAVGQTITFYATNDPNGPSVTRTVAALRQRIGSSDLYLCTLASPVPEGYASYAFATESIFLWSFYPYRNKEMIHFGHYPATNTAVKNVVVGKNILDTRQLNQIIATPAAEGPAVECTQDASGDPNFVSFETMAQAGDSGAPLFYDQGNDTLKLVGIAWYISSAPATGFSAVGNHASNIQSFITDNSLPYQPLAPSAFSGSRINSSQIDLTWQDNSAVETEFLLERRESEIDDWIQIANLPANTLSYSDTNAPAGDVFYRLTATNDSPSDNITTSILTPYSTWAAQFDWGSADQSPTADANNDGLANLVAYSMNLSPVDTLPIDALPYLESLTDTIDYFYRKNPDASDLSYTLKLTTDLVTPNWQTLTINGSTVTETDMGAVDTAHVIRIRIDRNTLSSMTFFQLEIDTDDPP